ncbi:MAG: hypothetical protein ACXVO9_09730 [Bacteroidia bacterium]
MSKTIIVINYERNKVYIAENLCVNRDEPESCCEGKCELKKQLDQDDKNEAIPDSPNKQKIEKSEYCDTGVKIKLIESLAEQIYLSHFSQTLPGFYSKNFRPPSKQNSIG